MHPRPPIGAARLGMNTFDVFEQQLILLHPGGLHPGAPFVESLAAHAQYPTGHRDVETVVGEFTDQREDYFGRTFSRAKYAAARLRISFSTSSWRAFLRNSASSRFSSLDNSDEFGRPASASSCASQFRRQDSEIDNSFAIAELLPGDRRHVRLQLCPASHCEHTISARSHRSTQRRTRVSLSSQSMQSLRLSFAKTARILRAPVYWWTSDRVVAEGLAVDGDVLRQCAGLFVFAHGFQFSDKALSCNERYRP